MDRGAWWAIDHGVAKSRTRLSDLTNFDETIKVPQRDILFKTQACIFIQSPFNKLYLVSLESVNSR